MTIGRQKLSEYDKRIKRAEHLAAEYPFAAKPLKFYERIARFQKELFSTLVKERTEETISRTNGDLRTELNLMVLLPKYPNFLALVEANAPHPLSAAAKELSRDGSASWIALLSEYWADGARRMKKGCRKPARGAPRCGNFWRVDSCKRTQSSPARQWLNLRRRERHTFVRSAVHFPCLAFSVRKAMEENDFCAARFARTNGDPQNSLPRVRRRTRRKIAGLCCGAISAHSRGVVRYV